MNKRPDAAELRQVIGRSEMAYTWLSDPGNASEKEVPGFVGQHFGHDVYDLVREYLHLAKTARSVARQLIQHAEAGVPVGRDPLERLAYELLLEVAE